MLHSPRFCQLLLTLGTAVISGCTALNPSMTSGVTQMESPAPVESAAPSTTASAGPGSAAAAAQFRPPQLVPIASGDLQTGHLCQVVTTAPADAFDINEAGDATRVRRPKEGAGMVPTTLMGRVHSVDQKMLTLVDVVRVPQQTRSGSAAGPSTPISGQVRLARSSILSAALLR